MKKIVLYIAQSLDGYIATSDHSVSWLEQLENPEGSDYGYQEFIDSTDTLIMGRKTYDIIRGFDIPWPYESCKTYILTSQQNFNTDTPDTHVITPPLETALNTLKAAPGDKNIWIVGGGSAITSLLKHQAIDEIILFTAPVLLGSGIPLFPGSEMKFNLHLEAHQSFRSGMLMSRYTLNY